MTGKIIKVKRIEETILWKKLKRLGDTKSNTLIAVLPTICEEAADRMKAMPATSPQYTFMIKVISHVICLLRRHVEENALMLKEKKLSTVTQDLMWKSRMQLFQS